MTNLYAIEFTDTFGGEANYCWVQRFCVRAKNVKQAITLAKKHRYHSPLPRHTHAYVETDEARIDMDGECVCAFISWLDETEYHDDPHRTYGEIIN